MHAIAYYAVARKIWLNFPTRPFFEAPLRGTPWNFWMKLTPQKLEMGLLYDESFIILTSTVYL